jgi:hypothetical protein
MYVIKISDNPNIDENEPQVFFNSMIHAREPQGMMTLMYYMYYLLENYGTDPEVTYLVDNREIYFLPVFNVDGYEYNRSTNPSGGGMWRKNRRNNGSGIYGVDLNRNWGFKWGYNNDGSSPSPSSGTYRGTAAFSEPETEAVRQFCILKNFRTALNYHTFGNLLITPRNYISEETSDSLIFREFASDMTQYNGYTWGIGPVIIYEVNGGADDWMYGEQTEKNKIISMTPEVGGGSDGFWPSQSRIYPLTQENLFPNLYITWAAGDFVGLVDVDYNQVNFNPGDNNVELIAELRNKGLSTAYNITAELTSLSSYITINSGSMAVDSIQSRISLITPAPMTFSISQSTPIGAKQNMLLTTYTGSVPMSQDTLSIILGVPAVVFEDTSDAPNVLWTISSTPANPKWEATSSTYYSSPTCFTDSKNDNYVSDATVKMTLTNPIDLTGVNSPVLSFWTKFEIENDWDYGQVEISTNNGSSWTPVGGDYSNPGTGSFQPNGEPVYDGTQSSWKFEQIDLSAYTGKQIKIRFELLSDESVERDGWYVDDIKIFYYSAVPVELISFNVVPLDKAVTLEWSTATELNNLGFEVQRSKAKKSWQTFGFVDGKGSTTEKQDYSFVDIKPITGKSFYRLVQVDFDGTKKQYESIEVSFWGNLKYNLSQNYPNPFNPSTKINFTIKVSGQVTLTMYNLLGQKIVTILNEFMDAGEHQVELSIENLERSVTSGVYLYTLQAEDFKQTRKMVVLK